MGAAQSSDSVGGDGGHPFSLTGEDNGATLRQLRVWVGGWQVRGVQIFLTDGRQGLFGKQSGSSKDYTFQPGECFTSLSLWGNGFGTRLGAIKFTTNRPGEFFVKMTDYELRREHSMDVGIGLCHGVAGRCGTDIDCMHFIFLKTLVMKNVKYPTMSRAAPQVNVEEIHTLTYENTTTSPQENRFEFSKKISETSSWTVANSVSATASVEVKAEIPKIVEFSNRFSYTLGNESTYKLEHSEERTEVMSFNIPVLAGKKVKADISIGRAIIELPYTGTVFITCNNGSKLQYDVNGVYKGLAYTAVKEMVKDI